MMLKSFENFRRRLKESQPITTPQELIRAIPNSDLITCRKNKKNRIVFNIGSNKYRMICGYHFGENSTILFIKFVGTHQEYDTVDVCEINMFKS